MKIKINYYNDSHKFIEKTDYDYKLVDNSQEATDFDCQYNAIIFLGVIADNLAIMSFGDNEIKSIEFI